MTEALVNLFKNLDDELAAFLVEKGTFLKIPKNQIFIREGAKNYDISFVISGLCRGYYTTNGEERTIFFRSDGDLMASYESIILGKPNKTNLQAITQTDVFTINYKHIAVLEQNNMKVLQTINEILKIQLANTLLRIENHISLSPKEHYLHFITEQKDIANKVPLKYVASYLGITPESLSRIRKTIS